MELIIGFIIGCIFTFVTLYLPSRKISDAYCGRLEERLKDK